MSFQKVEEVEPIAPDNRDAEVVRLPSGRFAKGSSGCPGGRPKAISEVIELAREQTAASIAALVRVRDDPKAPAAARVAAAMALLDRAWGKATAHVSVEDGDAPERARHMQDAIVTALRDSLASAGEVSRLARTVTS